jgi:dipeptidyl aminopeptidase/acylaminoacyl peptidase
MTRSMRPTDIGRLVSVGEPRIAPDGRVVAYVVAAMDVEANEYRSRVWLTPSDAASAAVPFTSGVKRDRLPRWSPDGSSLAFVSHRDGVMGSELYVLRVDGGEAARIASWPEEIDDLAWSPDGRWIAFGARLRDEARYGRDKDRDRPARHITRVTYRLDNVGWTCDRPRRLFVVPADGTGSPRVVVADQGSEEGHAGLAWSPDGKWLAFSAARDPGWDLERFADLFVVAAHEEDAEPIRMTRARDLGGVAYRQPSWSTDGARIAFVQGHFRRFPYVSQVGVMDVQAGAAVSEPTLLTTDLDRSCVPQLINARDPVWDGDDLWFQVVDGASVSLFRVRTEATNGVKPELVRGGDRAITGFDVAGGTLAFCATTPTMPAELFVLDHDNADERRVTTVTESFTSQVNLASPERFVAQSTGGAEVESWILRPEPFEPGRRYPALLNIHGGPSTTYSASFLDEFQYQAGAGYVVIYANPRGSDGYGKAWGDAIRGPKCGEDPGTGWGGVDYDDVMAVVDEALGRFEFIDPERLGVLGGSYGGFLTSWIVSHTDRFAAACSERAVNNQLTMMATSDFGYVFQGSYVGASHIDAPNEYLRMSPITYVKNIRTPLLILHSDGDLRCPIEQAEQLFFALRTLGRDVEFVRFPGEGHEMSRSGAPNHRIERAEIILEFFDRHLHSDGTARSTT